MKKVLKIYDFSADLKKMQIRDVTRALKNKNHKLNSLEIIGRWNILVSKLLLRHNNLRNARNVKNWTRLILKMMKKGWIEYRNMLVLPNKEMIAKLRQNLEK